MLTNVELINFKSHRSTQLNFDGSRLYALVGQNSSGKTSILQAVYYLSQLANSDFRAVFAHERSPEFIVTSGKNEFSVTGRGSWEDEDDDVQRSWEAYFKFEKRSDNSWSPTLLFWDAEAIAEYRCENPEHTSWSSSLSNAPHPIVEDLEHTISLKPVAANLAKASYSEAVTPQVGFDGSGLAPTLDYLRNEAPDRFQALQELLKQVIPGVHKIGVRRAKVTVDRQRLIEVGGKTIPYEESQEVVGQEVVLDMNTGDRIPAHAVSEGTILALGLLTVLMSPRRLNLVLLDDVEQGLHPKAQRELMTVFKQIIQANPNLQIIFSTHSPYIVDELTPSQVHVLSNTNSGFTRCKRLDEHPDVEWAKQTLTTGEFWDAEGEDWVTAGEVNA
ncbi:ATP-binding protein [Leptolyngbya sp. FACHB-17]|uniref:AAA family ATPase n=1 Tax=unclassified Leptolyngbya TaxID=2650499 RepID=UPI0016803D6E|nr:ATP-binding protein [Leptolyngbya sp. FACHB-17]MBD2082067.1 AAA family ATPase [Leptolyngbya sp. FACHB-17]